MFQKLTRFKNSIPRILIFAFVSLFFISIFPTAIQAASNAISNKVLFKNGEQQKREIVYGKLNADGEVDGIFVVNFFSLGNQKKIEDYGDYEEVIQLTGDSEIHYQDGQVLIDDVSGNYHYQGNLTSKDLPWIFELSYRFNDQPISSRELSGKSGFLDLFVHITQNERVNSSFFEQYALQISIPIDPDRVVLRSATEGAVVSYSGSVHQLTYIILPNSETNLEINMEVFDFAMGQMTIAGIPLAFNVDISLLEEELTPVDELVDGVSQLNNGIIDLNNGYRQLLASYQTILNGGGSLKGGGPSILSGVNDLQTGFGFYKDAIDQYTGGVSEIGTGYLQFDSGLRALGAGVEDVRLQGNTLIAGSQDLLNGLNQIYMGLSGQIPDFEFDEEEVRRLEGILLSVNEFGDALTQLLGGVSLLKGGLYDLNDGINNARTYAYQFPLTDDPIPQMSAAEWEYYLSSSVENGGLGLTIDGSESSKATLYNMLEEMSRAANGYKVAVGFLRQFTDQLSNTETGIPRIIGELEALETGLSYLEQGFNGSGENPGLADGIEQLIENVIYQMSQTGNMIQGLNELVVGVGQLKSGYTNFHNGLRQYVNEGIGGVNEGLNGTDLSGGLIGASSELKSGLNELSGGGSSISSHGDVFYDGFDALTSGLSEYIAGVSQFVDGLDRYKKDGLNPFGMGLNKFKSGVSEFNNEISSIKEQFLEMIENYINEFTGKDYIPISFVSEKNTHVSSVQFVIMTEEIPPSVR